MTVLPHSLRLEHSGCLVGIVGQILVLTTAIHRDSSPCELFVTKIFLRVING